MNVHLSGYWYPAGSSARQDATLVCESHGYRLEVNGVDQQQGVLDALDVSDRVGNIARKIYLNDGSLFESTENDQIDRLLAETGHRANKSSVIHRIESSKRIALASLVISVLLVGAFFKWGLPLAAGHIAHNMPVSVSEKVSDGAMATLDRVIFEPTNLTEDEQQQWRNRFNELVARVPDEDFTFKLHFRQMNGMPNALALPGGDIVVTDTFMQLVDKPEELDAVLLHEIGHVLQRHGLQHVLQASAVTVIVSLAIGEVSGIGELITGVPIFLMQSSYSRQSESSADDFAFNQMLELGIDPAHFATIIRKLGGFNNANNGPKPSGTENDTGPKVDDDTEPTNTISEYLSSHPGIESRAEKALQMSREFNK